MPRIVAFGCSFTYGDALPDCYIPKPLGICPGRPGSKPSRHAWPQKLADLAGVECVNRGRSGNSNKGILYDITRFKFEPGDIVFPMWTFFSRKSVLTRPNKIVTYGRWNLDDDDDAALYFEKFHTDPDAAFETAAWIEAADGLLRKRGVQVIHLTSCHEHILISDWSMVEITANFDEFVLYERGQDDLHPGKEAHGAFAQRIYNTWIR